MDLELTPDQRELESVAEQMLDRYSPLSVARDYLDRRGDAGSLFSELSGLGWYAVGLDADDPFGVTGLTLLAAQCGRHVTPNALVDTAVAARLAGPMAASDPGGLIGTIASGEAPVALAVLEPRADWSLNSLETTITSADDGAWLLSGTKLAVQHADRVDAFAVIGELRDGLAVAFVPADSPDVTITPQNGLDPSSAPAQVVFEQATVSNACVFSGPDVSATLVSALAVGAVATAAEALGAASRAFGMAVEYSLERRQFGRPIGSFQALQHLMADLYVQRETAWASVLYASATLDEGLSEALQATAIAKAHASRASRIVIEGALQVFGGIAFTWEHDAHLLQRRVLVCESRFGDAAHHEQRLGETLVASRSAAILGVGSGPV